MDRTDRFECLVVGGGPAGIACALECLDVRLGVLLIESGETLGGQLVITPNSIKNFPSGLFRDGEDLRRRMEGMVEAFHCPILLGAPVTAIDSAAMAIEAGGTRYFGRAIVIATGRRRRKLGLDGEERFAPFVTHGILPDPERFRGRVVAVVGGGDSAALDALELAPIASKIHLVHRGELLRARHDVQEQIRGQEAIRVHLRTEVVEIHGREQLEAITIREGASGEPTRLPLEGLVIKVGYAPNSEAFRGSVAMNEAGEILVGSDSMTSSPGIFAVGDIVAGSYWRVATAVGSGVRVVPEIQRFLLTHPEREP